jgi:hypothetical protein
MNSLGADRNAKHKGQISEAVLAAGVAALERKSHAWALLLAEGLVPHTSPRRIQVHREILAYGKRLLALRLEARGIQFVEGAVAGCLRLDSEAWRGESGGGGEQSAPSGQSAQFLAPAEVLGIVRGTTGLSVTPAAFDRFCRWTGMDSGCLGGSPEHLAGLVFYLVVFSLLTEDGPAPDVGGQKLLQKLRLCREELTQAADRWCQEMDERRTANGFRLMSSAFKRNLGTPPCGHLFPEG